MNSDITECGERMFHWIKKCLQILTSVSKKHINYILDYNSSHFVIYVLKLVTIEIIKKVMSYLKKKINASK